MESNQSTATLAKVDLEQIRELLHMNTDSRDGYAYAGKRLADKHSSLAMRFHRYSQERNDFCEKLKEIEEMNHEVSTTRGTIAASLHRTWMELRDGLSTAIDVSAVVIEAQRGEGYIKQAYELAIDTIVEPRLLSVLKLQYESVKESHSWLSGLRKDEERRKENAN